MKRLIRPVAVAILAAFAFAGQALAIDWQPVAAEDLKMTQEPKAPGANAIILYREVQRDDNGPSELVYVRIKILTEEGRKYANVELPFDRNNESINGIQARTIRPDGTIVDFDGQVFEKTIVKYHGVKYLTKTFTLPDVRIGGIVEYRYRRNMNSGYVYDSSWILSDELFTRRAKFSLDPYENFNLTYSWPLGLPDGTKAPEQKGGRVVMESHDIPAFVSEDYSPPEEMLKYRVEFNYSEEARMAKTAAEYWQNFGKDAYRSVQQRMGGERSLRAAIEQIVAPTDTPEQKLRKIYDRVQQMRNLTFERDRTAQEADRENLRENDDVGDVWKHGYGYSNDLTYVFLGLARAAGFTADLVMVSTRNRYFFRKELMNGHQLNDIVVVVKLDDRELYLDPGMAFAPFGVLPWQETGVTGLKPDRDGGTWVATPVAHPEDARIMRSAQLALGTDGALEGKVTVTYHGLEALQRRVDERLEDAASRKQYMEDRLKSFIPVGCDVELTNQPDWQSSSPDLVAEFKLRVPGWVQAAGSRLLLPAALFGAEDNRSFDHVSRQYPVYFQSAFEQDDDVSITLPSGYSVSSTPAPVEKSNDSFMYKLSNQVSGNILHQQRKVSRRGILVKVEFYQVLRNFYHDVRVGDEQQLVLSTKHN